jgi:hypothetical protein
MPHKRGMRSTHLAPIALALVAVVGCFGQSPDCPTDLPQSCPASGAPSYQSDVAPILAARCVSCHSAGGIEANAPLDTYAAVYARRGPVLDQVYACKMPQDAPLSPADRQTLLTWLVCDAPNN